MARVQVGLKLEAATVAALDQEAKARGLTRTQAIEAAVSEWIAGPEAGAVLATLPKGPPPSLPAGAAVKPRRSGKAVSAPVTRGPIGSARPGVVVTIQTETPPPMGRARVSQIDLPVGRERPAYGSMMKGAGKPRR